MTTLSGETLTVYRTALRTLRERGDEVTLQMMEAAADLALALSRSPAERRSWPSPWSWNWMPWSEVLHERNSSFR